MKRAVLGAGAPVWLVMDSSKIGHRREARFGHLSELSGLVSEHGVRRADDGPAGGGTFPSDDSA